jgi:dihydrofolate reductase
MSGKGFIAIAAMARNRVIGNQGKIPWRLPDEFRWFKEKTMGGILVMGRKTYESIGRPLPGRETIVISRTGTTYPGTTTKNSLTELQPETEPKDVFIAGGAEIYRQALPSCTDLFLTVVNLEPEGDTWFPAFETDFIQTKIVRSHPEFQVIHYRNLRCLPTTG